MIQHRRRSIKPEPIKTILLDPPSQVRQEKPQYLPPVYKTHLRIMYVCPDKEEEFILPPKKERNVIYRVHCIELYWRIAKPFHHSSETDNISMQCLINIWIHYGNPATKMLMWLRMRLLLRQRLQSRMLILMQMRIVNSRAFTNKIWDMGLCHNALALAFAIAFRHRTSIIHCPHHK